MRMNVDTQAEKARRFRAMHDRSRVLVLPNAWDAGSARLFARMGFPAVATTSGGVSWSLGRADGERASLDEVVDAVARIARTVDVPVTADMEAGFGDTPEAVARSMRAVIEAGAVGVNLEDGLHAPGALRDIDDATDRIRAVRTAADAAGVPLVINARTDAWLLGHGASDAERFDETVRRAKAFLAAGADCIFPIGLGDATWLAALVEAIDAPVNVAARPGMPDVAELGRIGVARVSTATRFATVAFSAVQAAAQDVLDSGRFDSLEATLSHADMQRMFDADAG
jgi:2-methylisocitrate lyase-like PEP mutase family enzyme